MTSRVFAFPRFTFSFRGIGRLCLTLAFLSCVAACGTGGSQYDKTASWSAEQLYGDAKQAIQDDDWKTARERLTAVESRYPFGIYAQQALISLAYVNWKDDEDEQALATIDRFQELYPNRPGSDYMWYLKGLIPFTSTSAFLMNLTHQDPSERDPKGLRAAYDAFHKLITEYPQSTYTPDAKLRLAWLVNTIAMNEVHVAHYYYRLGAYVAAANRAQTVITDFEGTPASEKALSILVKSYEKLNLPQLKHDAQRVLEANYPHSRYLPQPASGKIKPEAGSPVTMPPNVIAATPKVPKKS